MKEKINEDEKEKKIIRKIKIIRYIIILIIFAITIFTIESIAKKYYIENESSGGCESLASRREKDMYNAPIKRYTGESKKGSEVKQMIEEIISQNNQYVNEEGKFISVHTGSKNKEGYYSNGVEAFKNDEELDEACRAANIYENPENGENTQENIDEATTWMRTLKQKISAGKNYKVEEVMQDGLIYAVYITKI